MEIGDWKATYELNQIYREARALGIETHIAELEAFGFTVIEPQTLRAGMIHERMLEAVLKAESTISQEAHPDAAGQPQLNTMVYQLLCRDPVFIEGLQHPITLTLAKYLCGASCRLFASVAFIKRRKAPASLLHLDVPALAPLPAAGLGCNLSWILTEYTLERGTFAVMPGSHRYCRQPILAEQPPILGGQAGEDLCIPVEAAPGSLIAFAGNTWHGAYPKNDDGFRAHVVYGFCRHFIEPAESFADVPAEVIDTHGSELARLLSRKVWQGFKSEGPDYDKLAALKRATFIASA